MILKSNFLAIVAVSGYANVSFPFTINRPLPPSLSPSEGERVSEGRVRGMVHGSYSRLEKPCELPMNPDEHPTSNIF